MLASEVNFFGLEVQVYQSLCSTVTSYTVFDKGPMGPRRRRRDEQRTAWRGDFFWLRGASIPVFMS